MKASAIRREGSPRFQLKVMPALDEISKAVGRIEARWPDAVTIPEERDRERLALEMKRRLETWEWSSVSTARVSEAAIAVFDHERRDRSDLADVRRFYFEETGASTQQTFLDGMFGVYLATFDPDARHTEILAAKLSRRQAMLGARAQALLYRFSNLLSPEVAALEIAKFMRAVDDPYAGLKDAGFLSPHAPGVMAHAHQAFVSDIGPKLNEVRAQEQMLSWLCPPNGKPLESGAADAIEALLRPWIRERPSDERQSRLAEAIIAAYKDPRLNRGGIWAGFDPTLRQVLLRWLTKEDMRAFCDVVTATQNSHMWPPRRDFWLDLFEQGRIDEAWVAFGSSARAFALRSLAPEGGRQGRTRFGRQLDRNGDTSLLIMKIGEKIVVDGCHSYKTHIFRKDDPKAPRLYDPTYFCDDIMRSSKMSKPHNSIASWSLWVEQHI